MTIIVKQVYWYISQISSERLQDHWSSSYFMSCRLLVFVIQPRDALFSVFTSDVSCLQCYRCDMYFPQYGCIQTTQCSRDEVRTRR